MAQSAGLHEPEDRLTPETIDRHRAVVSIQEELEAVDWYDQRVQATNEPELASILAHNRDEEKEHAATTRSSIATFAPTSSPRRRSSRSRRRQKVAAAPMPPRQADRSESEA
jgi:hypothetical protein